MDNNSNGCLPYRIDCDSERGRHMIATRDFAAWDLIFEEEPIVVGPATKSRPVCLECLKLITEEAVFRCPGCKFPMCGVSCSGGPQHSKEECDILVKASRVHTVAAEEETFYASVFVLRMALLKHQNPAAYAKMLNLTHGDIKDPGLRELSLNIFIMLREVMDLQHITKDDVISYLGIKSTNAVHTQDKDINGSILYHTYSLMNHNCYSNTRSSGVIQRGGFTIKVYAQRPIASKEEITNRYIPPLKCQPLRQDQLWASWKFVCGCDRCADPTELGTHFSSLRCRECPAGFLTPLAPGMLGTPWGCGDCGAKLGHTSVVKLLQVLENRVDATKSCLEIALMIKAYGKKVVHPNHYLMFRLWDKLYFTSFKEGAYDEASLRQRIFAGEHLRRILERLDPGLSQRTETVLKILGADKTSLGKLLQSKESNAMSQSDTTTAVHLSTSGSHSR